MKRLERVVVKKEGEYETSRLPSNEEMINKINEIVDWINENQRAIDKVNFEMKFGTWRKQRL